ncbi:cytochrome c biogenesis protein ResB [Streptomyces sp. H10-C2]|uniref:cytochrome c biogenesis protein ResB n=1 Tax=unclassified Streptomyces TaxID=2593676 RepID=UPI0024BBE291|nr:MULTISPECIES: cytochrome c biogenesis protein ResB [unclassified Streptomyces]MDJ0341948.1 cytochrome c biogenesis protein ResB [Streptomyces sp. PH10-H1]MDJ0369921.1 cytochrome c biogenesis protein ResB [Streptomyces sp. H10-C2]MDJ0370078.1 cytochrome c biogenesis protein ResB [Streptomyces sp. H10-C2]
MSTESGPKAARGAEERAADERAADERETGGGTDGDLGSAGAQLSTAPVEELGQVVPGSFGGVRAPGWRGTVGWTLRECSGWVRWMWRQLTSMRIALILLFLLSLAAIPGSLVPQTSVDEVKAQAWQDAHPTVTPLYRSLGLFHVYSSPWFSAIYILLFISLAGCILPRSWQFVGQLRSRPPAAPRNLTRLPAYATWRTGAGQEQVLGAAEKLMRGRRFRIHRVGSAVASEKGFLREAGNLMFHLALFGLLISFAVGSLWKGEGGKLIVEGGGFSNSLTQYDDFKPGTFYTADDLDPFGFSLDSFEATYARSGPQKGTPRTFRANIHYWLGADGKETKSSIEVNQPLEIGGETVYLIGHGYAPVVTVRDARGKVVYQGPTPFLPSDGSLTSRGVVKVADNYRNRAGGKDQLAFSGIFAPTMVIDNVQGPHSVFPALDRPALVLTAYHGDLGVDSGLPQNVYQLNDKKMKQFRGTNGQPLKAALAVGDVLQLPDGGGSITFDGVKTWASFQVSHQVGNGWALGSAVAAILGLIGSLFIQRRRVWIRATAGVDGVTVVELAGLGRSESAKIADELGDLAHRLLPDAPALPDRDPDAGRAGPDPDADPDPGAVRDAGTTTDPSEEPLLPDEGARA